MRLEKAVMLLDLARRLSASADGMTLDEMASEIGVHRRTAQRLRDALSALFPQMEEIADGKSKRFKITNGLDGLYQSPTAEELSTLSVAADGFRKEGATVRADALLALGVKVKSAMRGKALTRLIPDVDALVRAECIAIQAGPQPHEDEALMAQIRLAILSMNKVAITYEGGSRPGDRRTLTPYGLMFGRANYLVGAEVGSDLPKHWRLDRITDLTILDEHAAPPPEFDMRTHAIGSFGIYRDDVEDVVLRIAPSASAEASNWRFHPSQTIENGPGGSLIVRFRSSGMLELAWHLFTGGNTIQALAPQRLKDTMREAAERFLDGLEG